MEDPLLAGIDLPVAVGVDIVQAPEGLLWKQFARKAVHAVGAELGSGVSAEVGSEGEVEQAVTTQFENAEKVTEEAKAFHQTIVHTSDPIVVVVVEY